MFLFLEELLQLRRVEALEDVGLKIEIFLEDLVVHGLGVLAGDPALVVLLLHLLHELVQVGGEVLETRLALALLGFPVAGVLGYHLSERLHGHGRDGVVLEPAFFLRERRGFRLDWLWRFLLNLLSR